MKGDTVRDTIREGEPTAARHIKSKLYMPKNAKRWDTRDPLSKTATYYMFATSTIIFVGNYS